MIDSYQTELNEKDADNKELADLLVARDKEVRFYSCLKRLILIRLKD